METIITSVKTKDSLSVVQFYTSDSGTFNYFSLDEAMKDNSIEIVEIGERGLVNDVYVINKSDRYVFLLDGDIITGAKQNRVVNTSVLLPPGCKKHLPVSCVEQGRWHKTSPKFRAASFTAPDSIRKTKMMDVTNNLENGAGFSSDQGKVWDRVHENLNMMDVGSETSDLGAIFRVKSSSIEDYLKGVTADENANGLSIFYGKKLSKIEIFNSGAVYRDYFPKLLKSASLKVLESEQAPEEIQEPELKYKTLDTLDFVEAIEKKTYPGIGAGDELRFTMNDLIGLELRFENKRIHQYVAVLDKEDLDATSRRHRIY